MSKGRLKAFKRAGRAWCTSCNRLTYQRSMSICQKSTWFGSEPLMIERSLYIQSSAQRTWPGCSEWLSSWPAPIWVFRTTPAQGHNYLWSSLKVLTQDLRGLMTQTCKSRWTIGMQRLEGLSNLRLNKNRDSRDLKCRMRQSRSCEKRELCMFHCLEWALELHMFCAEVALKSQVVYGQQQLFSTGAVIQIQRQCRNLQKLRARCEMELTGRRVCGFTNRTFRNGYSAILDAPELFAARLKQDLQLTKTIQNVDLNDGWCEISAWSQMFSSFSSEVATLFLIFLTSNQIQITFRTVASSSF